MHAHMHAYIHMHVHTHAYIHMHAHTHAYIHMHAHTHAYIHMHAHTHAYIHMHAHTHAYIHMHALCELRPTPLTWSPLDRGHRMDSGRPCRDQTLVFLSGSGSHTANELSTIVLYT